MTSPLDQPEPEGLELVYPFVACKSQGGPYDDDAFVAGVQLGRIDASLQAAAALGLDRAEFMVYTTLAGQLELVGMARGFPVVTATKVGETADHPAMPQWTRVVFEQSDHP